MCFNQQQADKEKILKEVAEYAQKYHTKPKYKIGDRINYSGRVYDEKELVSLVSSSLDFWLTSGEYTQKFEKQLAKYLGLKYCSFVNSGSSANLLAFMALTSPLLRERQILRGDEVITVSAGFPTTVSPILQYGAVPVFVDILIPQYNINTQMLENAISSKTKAVMLAHTLGNPFDIQKVKDFCDKYNLWLIEDNCDALGSKYIYNNEEKLTGSVGDISTSSFYPPHHITTGEGGAVYTDNPLLHKIIRSFRDWGRDCSCESGQDNLCGHRFAGQYGGMPKGYDHKYIYSHFGYNLKATDLQASIGVEQLKKVDGFAKKRIENFDRLKSLLLGVDELILPENLEKSKPSWFGFLITCKKEGLRNKLVPFLENNGIQTRMLFAGNIIKQPCFDEMRKNGIGYRVVGDLSNTDRVMNNGFWVGVYPGMTEEMIKFMAEKIIKGVKTL